MRCLRLLGLCSFGPNHIGARETKRNNDVTFVPSEALGPAGGARDQCAEESEQFKGGREKGGWRNLVGTQMGHEMWARLRKMSFFLHAWVD